MIFLKRKKEVTAELTSEKQTQLILGFLSTYCISNFKERMKRIMNGDIPISQLFHLFWQDSFYFYTTDEDTTVIVHVWSVNNRERITLCCQLYSDITTFNTLVNLIDEGTCTVNTIT